uniref:FAD-linked oxidase C-terminal domain-containing protein n=1 Tax=Paraburkholderia heleia TaxID=634127 RepID=UPI002ADD6E28|nr:FAD-linked oxidase C-terminal domain-containing protein [Paraburkholderia heleia]
MSKSDPVVGWEDAAVEPRHLGAYLREFSTLVEAYGYKTNLYDHFGDGCIHARITFDLRHAQGLKTYRQVDVSSPFAFGDLRRPDTFARVCCSNCSRAK